MGGDELREMLYSGLVALAGVVALEKKLTPGSPSEGKVLNLLSQRK